MNSIDQFISEIDNAMVKQFGGNPISQVSAAAVSTGRGRVVKREQKRDDPNGRSTTDLAAADQERGISAAESEDPDACPHCGGIGECRPGCELSQEASQTFSDFFDSTRGI